MNADQERIELERMARGERARAILEDPITVEAFAKIDAALVDAWRKTPHLAVDARERLHLAADLLGKLRSTIAEVMTTGDLAAKTLRQIERQPGALARLVGR